MKVNRKDLLWFIKNVRIKAERDKKDLTDEYLAEHLAGYIEVNPACVQLNEPSHRGRYHYSTVGYGVFSLFGDMYRMGRIEVFDKEDDSGYAVHEGAFSMPYVAANQFEDFMDALETDLPIHIEIGSHKWCSEECAKSLGFNNAEEMQDPDNVAAYRKRANDEYARSQGYTDWHDLIANSKFAAKTI